MALFYSLEVQMHTLCFATKSRVVPDVRSRVLFPDQKVTLQSRSGTSYTVLLMEVPLAAGVQFRSCLEIFTLLTSDDCITATEKTLSFDARSRPDSKRTHRLRVPRGTSTRECSRDPGPRLQRRSPRAPPSTRAMTRIARAVPYLCLCQHRPPTPGIGAYSSRSARPRTWAVILA
jgi:hypothetical protein